MIVHGLDFNPMRPQARITGLIAFGKQNKISRNCSFTLTRGLEVDGSSSTPSQAGLALPVLEVFSTRGTENCRSPSVYFAGMTNGLLDLRCLEIDCLRGSGWCRRRRCRSLHISAWQSEFIDFSRLHLP